MQTVPEEDAEEVASKQSVARLQSFEESHEDPSQTRIVLKE